MRCTPEHTDNSAAVISGVCFFGGVVSFLSSYIGVAPPLPLQLAGVALITAGIFVLVRFRLTRFSYRMEYIDDGTPGDIVVERVQGRSVNVVLRISSDALLSFFALPAKEWRKAPEITSLGGGVSLFSYCVNLHPSNPYAMVFDNGDGTYSVAAVEPDAEMRAYIENLLRSR